jgi:hypothetical protein
MIRLFLAPLVKRAGLLLALSGFLPVLLCAQVDSIPLRRQNAWVSAGIGAGMGGVAGMASGWYSNNHLVVGAHKAVVANLDADVHDGALLLGVRNLRENSLLMIAAGPARLRGDLDAGGGYIPRTVARNETGMAVAAEATINFPLFGIGFDAFVARSENRLVEGVVLSLQVGWYGN